VAAASLYDTGETAEYGHTLLTLVTCSYHTENGRFVVVARKSQERQSE
ncbi:MAG: class B sortase, partial [Clostridiales bacterium]|nr:class B sortase [Clostridiales bacterium]